MNSILQLFGRGSIGSRELKVDVTDLKQQRASAEVIAYKDYQQTLSTENEESSTGDSSYLSCVPVCAPIAPGRRRTGLDRSRTYIDPQSEWQDRAVGFGSTTSNSCNERIIATAQYIKTMRWSNWFRGYGTNKSQYYLIKQYKSEEMSSFEIECMHKEIKLLQSLKCCPGIIEIKQQLELNDGVRLVFDGQAEFLDRLSQVRRIPFAPHDIAAGIIKPVLIGLNYLHSAGIMVRNLQEETILVSGNGAVIANLFLHANKHLNPPFDRVGRVHFSAPEVLNKPLPEDVFQMVMDYGIGENDLPCYDQSADIWSLGVLVYKLFTGTLPFEGTTPEEIAEDQRSKLKRGKRLPVHPFINDLEIPNEAKLFMWECLQIQPENRKSAEQLLEHVWMQNSTGSSAMDFQVLRAQVNECVGIAQVNPRRAQLCALQEF
eukprot:TRINITY_DN2756_c0_g1_i1.p1 TRINITY_DN2756_c0_g1~~TRINITY_DN2756_c0_g1_i1.p1  ORF type:complete len:483 (+),score=16.09 TRINITY_DN2756_c0_g1_i1:157-1449(+)